jgi:hypothetical protein
MNYLSDVVSIMNCELFTSLIMNYELPVGRCVDYELRTANYELPADMEPDADRNPHCPNENEIIISHNADRNPPASAGNS